MLAPHPVVYLLTLNIIIYWRTLSYGLVVDDIEWYDNIRRYNIFKNRIWLRFYGAGTFGLSPRRDHVITLTLHIITCLLIAYIANPIAAILFSCHPCNHQTAIWLTGRRYSVINILFLTTIVTHTLYLLPIIATPITLFAYSQYKARTHLPYPPITALSILRTVLISFHKLSGLHKPMFIYPYTSTLSIAPYSQPCAERHLSIPLIFACCAISHIPFLPCLLFPLYALQSFKLQVMYHSIQSFYNYHLQYGITPQKQELLKRIYPSIR